MLSRAWLKANIPLFIPSKQSLTCPLEFLDKSVCPSLPAKEDDESTIKKIKNSNYPVHISIFYCILHKSKSIF